MAREITVPFRTGNTCRLRGFVTSTSTGGRKALDGDTITVTVKHPDTGSTILTKTTSDGVAQNTDGDIAILLLEASEATALTLNRYTLTVTHTDGVTSDVTTVITGYLVREEE